MAPKGNNEKKESGRAKKAENQAKKAEAAATVTSRKEEDEWAEGSKSKKSKEAEREAKKAADAARKAEAARQLAEEEAENSKSKPKVVSKAAGKKKATPPAGPGAIAAGGLAAEEPSTSTAKEEKTEDVPEEPVKQEFAATGLDEALEMLTLVTAKSDKATVGREAAAIEAHPERRFKAAFEAYKDQEMPDLKKERPGLRLQQYHEILYKQFQKSPDNPFNQQTIAYNAPQEERVEILKRQKERDIARYRQP